MRIEINGVEATAESLAAPATGRWGHFTAMQVRGGATRGLHRHLSRLGAAHREMFDLTLDIDQVRRHVRHALGEVRDASVRVNVYDDDPSPSIMVTIRPPGEGPAEPQRLQSVVYQRGLPHLKHLSSFCRPYYTRRARAAGYDDVVLTAADGTVAETAIHNIGFFRGEAVVWPDAPMLHGITMQLLETAVGSRRERIRLADLRSYDGAFLCNSRGIVGVAAIDQVTLPTPDEPMRALLRVYDAVPWDTI